MFVKTISSFETALRITVVITSIELKFNQLLCYCKTFSKISDMNENYVEVLAVANDMLHV